MNRLRSFRAEQYRGLDGLALDDLAPINIVTGPNGIGKTALIEAIWLFRGRFQPEILRNPNIRRSGRAVLDPVSDFGSGEVRLSATEDDGAHRWRAIYEPTIDTSAGARGQVTNGKPGSRDTAGPSNAAPGRVAGIVRMWLDDIEAAPTSSQIVSTPKGDVAIPVLDTKYGRGILVRAGSVHELTQEMLDDFSKIMMAGDNDLLKADLQIILPMVHDVEVVTVAGVSHILVTTTGQERLPLQSLGDGMVRLFHILIAMREAAGGMILLDEVENGLHHSILAEVWKRIRSLATKFEVQVFATTHSLECLDAAIAAFEDKPDDLAVHSLRQREDDNRIVAASFRGEALLGAREINLEIR